MAAYTLPLPGIPRGGISSYTDENRRVRAYHILNHTRCPAGGMGDYSFAREKCEDSLKKIGFDGIFIAFKTTHFLHAMLKNVIQKNMKTGLF